jgi:hypothetical protein
LIRQDDWYPSTNAGNPSKHSSVEHYQVFIQKWQILVQDKAAQGVSPQAQQRCVEDGIFTSRRRKPAQNAVSGPKDAIYVWTVTKNSIKLPVTYRL